MPVPPATIPISAFMFGSYLILTMGPCAFYIAGSESLAVWVCVRLVCVRVGERRQRMLTGGRLCVNKRGAPSSRGCRPA